ARARSPDGPVARVGGGRRVRPEQYRRGAGPAYRGAHRAGRYPRPEYPGRNAALRQGGRERLDRQAVLLLVGTRQQQAYRRIAGCAGHRREPRGDAAGQDVFDLDQIGTARGALTDGHEYRPQHVVPRAGDAALVDGARDDIAGTEGVEAERGPAEAPGDRIGI